MKIFMPIKESMLRFVVGRISNLKFEKKLSVTTSHLSLKMFSLSDCCGADLSNHRFDLSVKESSIT